MVLNDKQKFIKKNFEYHARITAHVLSDKQRLDEHGRDVVYQAIMAFMDSAFENNKIMVKEEFSWDEEEKKYSDAMRDEAIRRGEMDGLPSV